VDLELNGVDINTE
jgi:hypothetical protein